MLILRGSDLLAFAQCSRTASESPFENTEKDEIKSDLR
jgi:hypothetical protein